MTARDDANKSLSSNQINALEVDSAEDKDYISHHHHHHRAIPHQLKVQKINSDSTIQQNNLSQNKL